MVYKYEKEIEREEEREMKGREIKRERNTIITLYNETWQPQLETAGP